MRPIFINFHTKPLSFDKYLNIIHNAYSKHEIRVITIAPSIEVNSLHKKKENKDGSTAVNISSNCLITNYQKIIDYKMSNIKFPIILHPRLGGLVKNTILYNEGQKIYLDTEY